MWDLPTFGNHIIQYETGDGFRTHLPRMLSSQHLYVGHKAMISQVEKSNARCVTVHKLKKILESETPKESMIVIDIRLPRIGTQAFKALQDVVRDRSVTLLHPPLSDVESANTLMTLLPLTKRKTIRLKKWSLFMRNKRF